MRLTPDGRHLYASDRRSSTVAALVVDKQSGRLTLVDHFSTENQPRGMDIDPSGKWLGFVLDNRIACCDVHSGDIIFLTQNHGNPPSADAVVFSPDGQFVAWMEEVDGFRQLWMTETGR